MNEKLFRLLDEIKERRNSTVNYINKSIDNNGISDIMNADGKKVRKHSSAKSSGQKSWNENDHPRDESGQFTYGGGSSAGAEEKKPDVKTEKNKSGDGKTKSEEKPKLSDVDRKKIDGRIEKASDSLKGKRSVDSEGKLKTRYQPKAENFAEEGFGVMQSSGKSPEISKEGKNESFSGFANGGLFDQHYIDHVCVEGGMGDINQKEYFKKAQDLFCSPVGGDIDGTVMKKDGVEYVVRFNKKTGEFVKGVPGGVLKTYMIAKVDIGTGKVDLEKANEYWRKEKARCEESLNEG